MSDLQDVVRVAVAAERAKWVAEAEVRREKLNGIYLPMSLVREIGLNETYLYCYVLNRLPQGNERVVSLKVSDAEKETGLNDYQQRKLLKRLSDLDYLRTFIEAKGYTGKGDEFEGPRRNIEVLKLPTDIHGRLLGL